MLDKLVYCQISITQKLISVITLIIEVQNLGTFINFSLQLLVLQILSY